MRFRASKRGNKKKEKEIERKKINSMALLLNKFQREIYFRSNPKFINSRYN